MDKNNADLPIVDGLMDEITGLANEALEKFTTVHDSNNRFEWHHFKVMQLRVHEDTKDQSECKVRFHFYHEMLKKRSQDQLKSVEWDIGSKPV